MTDQAFKRYIRTLVSKALRDDPTHQRTKASDVPLETRTDEELQREIIHRLTESMQCTASLLDAVLENQLGPALADEWLEEFWAVIHLIRCIEELKRRQGNR
jgi:two-component sensor histidine kinase